MAGSTGADRRTFRPQAGYMLLSWHAALVPEFFNPDIEGNIFPLHLASNRQLMVSLFLNSYAQRVASCNLASILIGVSFVSTPMKLVGGYGTATNRAEAYLVPPKKGEGPNSKTTNPQKPTPPYKSSANLFSPPPPRARFSPPSIHVRHHLSLPQIPPTPHTQFSIVFFEKPGCSR